jgi:eukaryotic-like serine/threonine-protein kinase
MAENQGRVLGATSTVLALGETQLGAPDGTSADSLLRPAASDGDRYHQLGLLGQGGMGVVHRVWDADLLRDLAVKRMRPDLRGDERLVAQFVWEARVTAYLDHPLIVPVHDLGTAPEGGLYFSMKRVDGTPLDRALDGLRAGDAALAQRLPLARRLRLMHQICQAIAFAHERGVLHRDLKPGNVMLGGHGEVLVMDWGLALPLAGPAGERLRRVMPSGIDTLSAGTPLYMSPEQARGELLDERSDVFTLGVMLYELVSLVRPFAGASLQEIQERVAAGTARPLAEVMPAASSGLCAVAARALAPAPVKRYPSVAALADDLERVIDGETPEAEKASLAKRAARYYMGRDRAMSQLRVFDIDMGAASATFLGITIGALCARWLRPWWWLAAAAVPLFGLPPFLRWLSLRRAPRTSNRTRS